MGTTEVSSLYEPLEQDQIRVLKFESEDNPGLIRLELRSLTSSDSKAKEYAALSYTWEPESPKETITINGYPFQVGYNLWNALREMHTGCGGLVLKDTPWWVDQICINQSHLLEKEAQVGRMGEIYAKANHVVAWLGSGDEACTKAMIFLNKIGQIDKKNVSDATAVVDTMPDILPMLKSFFAQGWLCRAWTFQEYVLPVSNSYELICGGQTIHRIVFERALWWLNHRKLKLPQRLELLNMRGWKCIWKRRKVREQNGGHTSRVSPLCDVLLYAAGSLSRDDRDQIYALMGMASDVETLGIIPSYAESLSPQSLFVNVARAHIRLYRSLDLILFGTHGQGPNDYPSWAPYFPQLELKANDCMAWQGFSSQVRITRCPDQQQRAKYKASGTVLYQPEESNNSPNLLMCHGIRLGVVDGLGPAFCEDVANAHSHQPDRGIYKSTSLVNTSCDEIDADKGVDELELEGLHESLWRTLMLNRRTDLLHELAPNGTYTEYCAFCDKVCQGPTALTADLRTWAKRNAMLLIRGRRLSRWLQLARKPMQPSQDIGFRNSAGHTSFERQLLYVWQIMGKRLGVTEEGLICVLPPLAQKNDQIWVLLGASIPVLLRTTTDNFFQVVGESYVDGYMDGEAIVEVSREKRAIQKLYLV